MTEYLRPVPSAWTRLREAADPLARSIGLYTAYTLPESEYVGSVDRLSVDPYTPTLTFADLRDYLAAHGYEPQYLSAAKRHPETGSLHLLSVRRVPDEHPEAVAGTALSDHPPGACQYHVHVCPGPVDGQYDLFSHYELRPLPMAVAGESCREAVARSARHYRPQGAYLQGVTDLPAGESTRSRSG